MKNKETLEEAAEIFVNNRFTKQISGDKTYPDIYASKEAIIESHILFAKWQQENSYSEEEVYDLMDKREHYWVRYKNSYAQSYIPFDEWFEQFKKK
ncbi:MAG: hypothetical protein JHC33_11230 [Ignisphaera sp.]|nr:hypothetical protein [Ignisphaera sp.]